MRLTENTAVLLVITAMFALGLIAVDLGVR